MVGILHDGECGWMCLVDVVEDILNDEADDQKDEFGDYTEDEDDLELERRFLEVGSSLLKLLSAYNLNNNDGDKGNNSEIDDMIPLSETEDDGTEENSCSSRKK